MTRRAAVLGHPVEHSLSPVLHQAAYAQLGLDWQYERHDVTAEDLSQFISGLDSSWAGLSVTMPLKERALQLVEHVEPLAGVIGAVNTILLDGGRPYIGANTDVYGMVTALGEAGLTSASTGAVIGAGATAASALAALGQLGVRQVAVFVRAPARGARLIPAATRMGLGAQLHRLEGAGPALGAFDVVISTVPAGTDELLTQVQAVTGTLLDVRYDERPTPLVRRWRELGGNAVTGERMLLHQAGEQIRLMTGHPAPIAAMDEALQQALRSAAARN